MICNHIKSQVEMKFPDKGNVGVGSFLFLRFYNTAISVPESFGFLQQPLPRDVQRRLLLVTKVLQQLVNGVQFGSKEKHMVSFNPFIEDSQPKLEKFYKEICQPVDGILHEQVQVTLPEGFLDRALSVLAVNKEPP
eukprot:TRINITY_DN9427_c0_g1_i1.p1 TRINITY_DN9427_c0_g1~~TRINITY_DN9427_c0_g1_i1.p1  ORF type:complete len:136 (-),score=28.89 TRINITY_DN9427_c0_g1_i1:49-456(-)